MPDKKYILVLFALIIVLSPCLSSAAPSVEYLCELGKSYFKQGNYEDAIHELNKALIIDPNNLTAKKYIGMVFKKEHLLAQNQQSQVYSTRDRAMSDALKALKKNEKVPDDGQNGPLAPLKVSGELQLSMGSTPDDSAIWQRANGDLNERNFRILSENAFNRKTNTYDPRIFDRLRVNLDTTKPSGFNLHTNITVDPWSYTGKSNKITIPGVFGDSAEFELKYWSNTGYTINETVRTLQLDNSIGMPEVKVVDGWTEPFSVSTNFSNVFNIPALKIDRQFQPLREFWLDYAEDSAYKFRFFPIAYQDQALSSDDPLGLANHHIWWEESQWLSAWDPGQVDSGFSPVNYTSGKWDNSLSFFTRDSDGTRLTALRGLSFELYPAENTSFANTFASPKGLWQDYETADNLINAMRLKHRLSDNLSLGALYTFRMGLNENERTDALNHVWAFDAGFSPWKNQKLSAEVAASRSQKDKTQVFETESRGNAYYLQYFGTTQDEDVLDLRYGYDEIRPKEESNSFFAKYRFFASRMEGGFEQTLSNYRYTRNDSFWSRHLHFRPAQQYFYQGLYFPSLTFDDIKSSAIGDGIDIGRDVLGFRLELSTADSKLDNLFDIRNVHNNDGKYIETVTRDEVTYKLTDKLTLKGLGLLQDLPKTSLNTDPFIYDGDTGEFIYNNTIAEGNDPTLKTGSLGFEYAFTDWLALNGIWERTNDSSLAYANYPRGNLNGLSVTTVTRDGLIYREDVPFLYSQSLFPLPPYAYFNVFKSGLRINPTDKTQIYFDYTRNEYKSAGQIDDNINHVGMELAYTPTSKLAFYFRYVYSRWNDINRMVAGMDRIYVGHHNAFAEVRFRPGEDDEFLMQYGESGRSLFSDMTYDPFGGGLTTLDTQHIIRMYYRRRF